MAKMRCPKCGSEVPSKDGWAKAALSTTIAAPAIPDMATQVRCPSCQAVFAQSDVIYAGTSGTHRFRTIASVGIVVAVAWVVYQFMVR